MSDPSAGPGAPAAGETAQRDERLTLVVRDPARASFASNLASLAARQKVRQRVREERGRQQSLFVVDVRGTDEALRQFKGALALIVDQPATVPARPRLPRPVVAALWFFGGLAAVLSLFALS